jgi:hypothetical protein
VKSRSGDNVMGPHHFVIFALGWGGIAGAKADSLRFPLGFAWGFGKTKQIPFDFAQGRLSLTLAGFTGYEWLGMTSLDFLGVLAFGGYSRCRFSSMTTLPPLSTVMTL